MTRIPVYLSACPDYEPARLQRLCGELLDALDLQLKSGERVLVKPNLIASRPGGLACTNPSVTRAVCQYLLDHGARVSVGDSPAMGGCRKVAQRIGLVGALADLDAPIVELNRPSPLKLSFGSSIGVSRRALDQDRIFNLPRLKAHNQLRVTAAVKNLFGCVTGVRKPLAHSRFGEKANHFEAMLAEVMQALPPTVVVMDAVVAMHRRGPLGGEPYPLGLLGASVSSVGLDTAVYHLLGLTPKRVAVWSELQRRTAPGAMLEDLAFPWLGLDDCDASGFEIPEVLDEVSFAPPRLAKGALKRLWARLPGSG